MILSKLHPRLKTMPKIVSKFVAVAACDPQGVIGKSGALPWHFPEDLNNFRRITLDNIMIMGYKTYLSMPVRAFKERISFVFTKSHKINPKLATPVSSLAELIDLCSSQKHLADKTCFVIGGGIIFELFFTHSLIESAIITHLKKSYEGDTYFPLHYLHLWQRKNMEETKEFSITAYCKPILPPEAV